MITYSGVRIEPLGKYGSQFDNVPGLRDIAIQTHRIARYAGSTQRLWSVLQHLLAGLEYLRGNDASVEAQLSWLLHDAHEAITSDIPNHWKTEDMKQLQRELDEKIYFHFGVEHLLKNESVVGQVHDCDLQILYAEAYTFGPPGIMLHLPGPEVAALVAVESVIDTYGNADPRDAQDPIVLAYLRAFADVASELD